jgi:hypothetical protein
MQNGVSAGAFYKPKHEFLLSKGTRETVGICWQILFLIRKLEKSVIRQSLFKYVIAHESLSSAVTSLALKAYKTTQVLLKDWL